MSMPRSRWPLFAAVGLILVLQPGARSAGMVQRVALVADTSFHLADSVRAILTAVTRVVVAPDSSIYISDWQFPAILHLEQGGSLRRTLGRAGAGPGEFHQVLAIGLYRDSIWAMDPAQVRVTLFPLRGEGVQTLPYGPYAARSLAPGSYSRRGMPTSLLQDGSVLLEENTPDPTRPTSGALLRVDRTMRVLDTVIQLPAQHSSMAFEYRDGGAQFAQPFSDDPLYAVSSDGSLVVLVARRSATSEDGGEFLVTVLRNGTEEVFRRPVQYQPRRLTNRVVDSTVTAMAGGFKPQGMVRSPVTVDSVRSRLFRPAFYPPVQDVRVGRDGTVWLKIRFGDSASSVDEWLQLSPRGFPQRRVTTPNGFRLLEADRRMVWGAFTDSLDLPQVGRFEVGQSTIN